MKLIVTIVISVFFSLGINQNIPFDEISKAFSSQDAGKVMSYAKEKVLINILGDEGVYGGSQGSQVLKNFFNSNPCESFNFNFKGKETSSHSYAIGKYQSKNKSFKISIKLKKEQSSFKIESIQIDNY